MEIVFFFKSKYDPGISINHVMKPIVETIGKSENIISNNIIYQLLA